MFMKPPAAVRALAEKVKGKPIAWKEYPDGWKVVFQDGRKIFFLRSDAELQAYREREALQSASTGEVLEPSKEAFSPGSEDPSLPERKRIKPRRKGGSEE
jgi:hypothetical protein